MTHQTFLNGKVELYGGDSREVLKLFPENHFDSIVCDPPYALVSIVKRFGGPNAAPAKGNDAYMRASAGFMNKSWDVGDTVFSETFWAECLRVLKPGGHVVAFSGTRTYHRMAVAIEDAGFEIRDQLAWAYGSGFPKSHNVGKAIDRELGATREKVRVTNVRNPKATGGGKDGMDCATRPWIEAALERGYHEKDGDEPATNAAREWQGWGTALKPAWEPICLARKPLIGTVAENVLEHGTGAINVDGCRVGEPIKHQPGGLHKGSGTTVGSFTGTTEFEREAHGRWPANIVHDGSDEVLAAFPDSKSSGPSGYNWGDSNNDNPTHVTRNIKSGVHFSDYGSAARFFYTAKADKLDRIGSKHPTVKPVDLMQWLCRLVTPPGGLVLDPFAGSGSTGEAAWREGMRCILVEREEEYQADIAERLRLASAGPMERKARAIKQADNDNLPLFGGAETGGAAA